VTSMEYLCLILLLDYLLVLSESAISAVFNRPDSEELILSGGYRSSPLAVAHPPLCASDIAESAVVVISPSSLLLSSIFITCSPLPFVTRLLVVCPWMSSRDCGSFLIKFCVSFCIASNPSWSGSLPYLFSLRRSFSPC